VILPSDTTVYKALKTNFAPRLSVAWSPFPNKSGYFGGGKTVIRAGFGINYGPGQVEDQIQPIESDRISSTLSNVTNAFPLNIPQVIANFNGNPDNRQYQPRAYFQDLYRVPERIYSYSFSIQQELPYKMALTLAYVGSRGRNLFLRSVTNQITQVLTNSNPASNAVIIREFDKVQPNGSVLKPFAEVDVKLSGGHDSYNALQTSLARRFNTGLVLNAQYTFGRSFGNTAGSNEALTAANNARRIEDFDYDNGFNTFDVRHTFNISAVYELPFGSKSTGLTKVLAKGWEAGAIVNARSGLPIQVQVVRPDVLYVDAAGNYYSVPAAGRTALINTPGGGGTRNVRRPDLIGDPFVGSDRQFLNPAAFALPQPGKFGNLQRGAIHGPSFTQFDMVFGKKFPITERTRIEFRAEFFNIFNISNFANPPATLNSPICGSSVVPLPGEFYCINVNATTGARTPVANVLNPGQAFTQGAAGGTWGILNRTVERTVGLGANRQIQFGLRLSF